MCLAANHAAVWRGIYGTRQALKNGGYAFKQRQIVHQTLYNICGLQTDSTPEVYWSDVQGKCG